MDEDYSLRSLKTTRKQEERPLLSSQQRRGEITGNIISRLFFWPAVEVVKESWDKKLTSDDLWSLEDENRGAHLLGEFKRYVE
jgi:hypothetical protein